MADEGGQGNVSFVSKGICRVLIVCVGMLSVHAARAELIQIEPAAAQSRLEAWGAAPADAAARTHALTEAEAAALQPDAPAGGDLGTVAVVFILMFMAIFVLSVRPPERD